MTSMFGERLATGLWLLGTLAAMVWAYRHITRRFPKATDEHIPMTPIVPGPDAFVEPAIDLTDREVDAFEQIVAGRHRTARKRNAGANS